jgi:hypothetical protein
MKDVDRDKDTSCPLLVPEGYGLEDSSRLPFYCRRPDGRVRVPTRAELRSLCFDARYGDCPGYRRAVEVALAGASWWP